MDANDRRARVVAEASAWWLELQSQKMSYAEREQFVIWLRESPVHVSEMLRIAQVHNALAQFDRWANINTESATSDTVVDFPLLSTDASFSQQEATPSAEVEKEKRRWLFQGMRLAGVFTAIVAMGVFLLALPSMSEDTIETERGERREVALSDGSVLQVDPQTKLRVKFEQKARTIVLERGRALFRVAKDVSRPLAVQTDDMVVHAVGTAFAVDRSPETIVITVAEGKVLVSPVSVVEQSNSSRWGGHASRDAGNVPLTANQQFRFVKKGAVEAIHQVDVNRELAWAAGRLIFDNATVAEAIADLNRYNRIQLRISDRVLAAHHISGVFNTSDPESFIAFLQTVASVRILRGHDQVITIASADG